MTQDPSIEVRASATPYRKDAFAKAMAALGPFEPSPHIALGASGGADSTALLVLLADWVQTLNGKLSVFTVDHGLRLEAASEADEVARLCARLGASHRTLVWEGPKPTSGIQEAARAGRYRLLEEACRRAGILHLALAHQRDDQAETFLIRLGRGSGLAGLAGMPQVRFLPSLRVIRPLLGAQARALRAFLRAEGCSWVEDPSNQDRRFARVRVRTLLRELDHDGFQAERLGAAGRTLAGERREVEEKVAKFLARALQLYAWGGAALDRHEFSSAVKEEKVAALGQLLQSLGGHSYPPRSEAVKSLLSRMEGSAFAGATLAGLRIEASNSSFYFYRESRGLQALPIKPGCKARWDGRFDVTLSDGKGLPRAKALEVAPLGMAGWKLCKEALGVNAEELHASRAVPSVRGELHRFAITLPALWGDLGLLSQPHLGYNRGDWGGGAIFQAHFRPEKPTTRLFTLV